MSDDLTLYTYPRHSMYATNAYIGVVLGVNVGIYDIHGVFGYRLPDRAPRQEGPGTFRGPSAIGVLVS